MRNIIERVNGIVTHMEYDLGVKITIEDDDKELHEVRLPVNISNEFELMPYQIALLDEMVKYLHTVNSHQNGKNTTHFDHYQLEVLSGMCVGSKYELKR